MEMPKSHTLQITEMEGDDAGAVLFNKLINGERVKFLDGTTIDAEEAIRALTDKYSFKYENDFMVDEDD